MSKHSEKRGILNLVSLAYCKIRAGGRKNEIISFLSVSFLCIIIGAVVSGVRIGYNFKYSGKTCGKVLNAEEYKRAVNTVCKTVDGEITEKNITNPQFSKCLMLKKDSTKKDELVEIIIDNSENIVEAYKTSFEGQTYYYPCSNRIDVVENYLLRFNVNAVKSSSEYTERFNIEKRYCLSEKVENGSLIGFLSCISVKTEALEEKDLLVDYNTVTVKDSEMLKGTVKIQSEGSKGHNRLTEKVTYLNGIETGRDVLKNEVLSLPEDRIIVEGTAEDEKTVKYRVEAHKAGFIFPLPKESVTLGDSFGAGRNHKGYDLLAPYGTEVYAVKEGVVIRSSWYSGYGYCVDIDHGNGLVTRYGHASKLLKKVGDRALAGDVISLVGSTGDSYGNHVHFEVLKNGKRVNPAAYLRLE